MSIEHSEQGFSEPRDWNDFLGSRRRLGLSVAFVLLLSMLGWVAIALLLKLVLA